MFPVHKWVYNIKYSIPNFSVFNIFINTNYGMKPSLNGLKSFTLGQKVFS